MIAAPPGIKAQYEARDPETQEYVEGHELLEAEVVAFDDPETESDPEALILLSVGRLVRARFHMPLRGAGKDLVHYGFVGLVGDLVGTRQKYQPPGE